MSAQSESRRFQNELFFLVLLLFFASGFSSLVYQVVWTRHLVLIFGSTTLATATVLAVFMGGLALGSFWAGRVADKVERPFLWYGILEGIIGAWALIVPILLDISVSSYRVIWELTHFDFFSFSLLRLALAAMILLLPTTLMGATLPLLSKYVADSLATVGKRVGTIYAANTLGAVCGAAQSGLVLLPGLGLNTTNLIAAGINFFLLINVLYISAKLEKTADKKESKTKPASAKSWADSKKSKSDHDFESSAEASVAKVSASSETSKSKKKKKRKGKYKDAESSSIQSDQETAAKVPDTPIKETPASAAASVSNEKTDEKKEPRKTPPAKVPNLIYVALGAISVSGATAMIYEVCWTRTLCMVIGGSTYAFTVMLSTFLSGIFLGSFLCARVVDKFKQPYFAFGVLQMFVAVGCLTSLMSCHFLPEWNLILNKIFSNPLFSVWVRFILAEAMLLPLTLCLGALFPIVIKCTASDIEHVASSVGTVYSANTLGAIVGSVLAGFVLIPQFGVEKTMIIATGVNVMLGAVMLFAQKEAKPSYKFAYTFVGVFILVAFILNPNSMADRKNFLLAQSVRRAMRDGYDVFDPRSPWRTVIARTNLVYYKDGPCSNVAVLRFSEGDKIGTYSLLTNGCVDASDGADMSQQILLASYPMLFRPNSRRACVIGWGSGITVAELLNFPITSVTAVELEPSVIEAAKVFDRHTHEPEKNPRVKIEINDGRNFLLATTQKFDIIVSEPSNPWQVGVCNLFTAEYFDCVRDRLTPDGVLSLWLQLGEVSPDSIKAVLKALESKFNYCLAMASDQSNLVVLASQKPITADYQLLSDAFKDPYIASALDKAKITSPEGVLSRMLLTPSGVSYMVRDTKPNTDDLNSLEFKIGRTYESMTFGHANGVLLSENMGRPSGYVNWGKMSKENIAAAMARVAIEATKFGHLTSAYSWARSSMDTSANNVAKKVMYWLEQEDQKRTDAARARGEIEALDPSRKASAAKSTEKSTEKPAEKTADTVKVKSGEESEEKLEEKSDASFEKSLKESLQSGSRGK